MNTNIYGDFQICISVPLTSTFREVVFYTAQKIARKLRIWSHLLKKSLMENFHFLCSASDVFISSILLYKKWSTLQDVNIVKCLKYVWPAFNIMLERV